MTPIDVLRIKNANNNWISVPAIKGTSVIFKPGEEPKRFNTPAEVESSEPPRSGWEWTFFDEAKSTSYEMKVYDGAAGDEISVDNIGVSGGTNINLYAVRYGDVQTLSSGLKALARANIGAMELLSATESQVAYFNGTAWTAADVNFVPNISAENSSYVLTAINSQAYGWSALPTITISAILSLFDTGTVV